MAWKNLRAELEEEFKNFSGVYDKRTAKAVALSVYFDPAMQSKRWREKHPERFKAIQKKYRSTDQWKKTYAGQRQRAKEKYAQANAAKQKATKAKKALRDFKIRKMLLAGASYSQIYKELGAGTSTVKNVKNKLRERESSIKILLIILP